MVGFAIIGQQTRKGAPDKVTDYGRRSSSPLEPGFVEDSLYDAVTGQNR
jgi:hypothetical protein